MTPAERAIREAFRAAGGKSAMARKLKITRQTLQQWRRCPPLRVLEVERISGIPRHVLRPDIYPPPSS